MRKHKTSGFTLAEIAVCMAAASILMLASGSVLVFGNRTYHHYALSVRAGETGDAIADVVRTRLQYAADVLIEEEDGKSGDSCSIRFTQKGNFLLDGKEAYGNLPEAGLISGCRITPLPQDIPILQIEVYITDLSGCTLYRSRETIPLINMELNGETVDCRIVKRDGIIDSVNQDVMLGCLENGRRYEQDE